MKKPTVLILGAWFACAPFAAAEPARASSLEELSPRPGEIDARPGWWRQARFGMFSHWGVYSGSQLSI